MKIPGKNVPASFQDIVLGVTEFIVPVVSALVSDDPAPARWVASGLWV